MPNTVQPHFSQNVFLNQSHSVIKQQQNLGVRQDKRANFSARIASQQPASLKKVMRAQQPKKDTPRTQNKPNPKRKTVQLTFRSYAVLEGRNNKGIESLMRGENLCLSHFGYT